MSKHYKPLLAKLKAAGKAGVYNHELQQVAHRFGARLQELRDGKFDGKRYNIDCTYISPGVYKYILKDVEEKAEYSHEDMKEITETFMSKPKPKEKYKPKVTWNELRQQYKHTPYLVSDEMEKLKHKIIFAEEWIRLNKKHKHILEAHRRYGALLSKYEQMKQRMYEKL